MHRGVDIRVPSNTPLQAFIGGKVIAAGTYGSGSGYNNYGNVVVIEDHQGRRHVYAHMNSVSVRVGQVVNAGTMIGKSGSTGRSTGPHLHYEVRTGGYGTDIDPMQYLSGTHNHDHPGGHEERAMQQFSGNAYREAPGNVRGFINSASKQYGIRPELIGAIIKAESSYKVNAQSHAGAYGLMQLMPWAGSARYNPQSNVNTGTQYIKQMLQKYGDIRLALSAYNWGPGNLDKLISRVGKNWRDIERNLPSETKRYVPKVLGFL